MEPWTDIKLSTDFFRRFHSKRIEDFIEKFPTKPWDYNLLISYLSIDFIVSHLYLPWNRCGFSQHPDLTWDLITKLHQRISFDWKLLSMHPNISFKLIKENPSFPWCPKYVLFNPSLTPKDIKDPFFKGVHQKIFCLCSNPNIPVEFLIRKKNQLDWAALTQRVPSAVIYDNPDLPWDTLELAARYDLFVVLVTCVIEGKEKSNYYQEADILSAHPQICLAVVKALGKPWAKGWNWQRLSKSVPVKDILENPDRPWDPYIISAREGVTYQVIRANPNVKWDISTAIMAGNIGWQETIECPGVDWGKMAASPLVTWDIIKNNPDKPWDKALFSTNVNLTADVVKENPDVAWWWIFIVSPAYVESGPTMRHLVKEQRKKSQKAVLEELEKNRLLIPDVNTVISEYVDYE